MNDIANSKTLHIAKKLLSLLGKFEITDDEGNVLYECAAHWGWFNRRWRISQDGTEVAVLQRKILSLVPAWDVRTSMGDFTLRGQLWAWRRRITVQGGQFDGAVLKGGLFDMNFELSWQDQVLAKAEAEFISIRTRHSIELLDRSPQTRLLTAILMTNLMMQKGEDRKAAVATGD
jgi:uncharacterized protein YxjI